jgi:hypothetical protein
VFRIIFTLFLAACLSACAWNGNHQGYVQFYQGKPMPLAQMAIVKGHNNYRRGSIANDMVRIVAINDEEVPSEWGVAEGADAVGLMPGHYSIKVLFVSGYSDVDFYDYRTLPLEVKSGCRYEITAHMSMPSKMLGFDILPSPLGVVEGKDCALEDRPPEPANSWKS